MRLSVASLAVQQDSRALRPSNTAAARLPDSDIRPGHALAALLGDRKLLHYCQAEAAALIQRNGLKDGSWCTVTAFSSHVADAWLGTSTRRNQVVVIEPALVPSFKGPGTAHGSGYDALNQGGAIEFYLPEGAPASAILEHHELELL